MTGEGGLRLSVAAAAAHDLSRGGPGDARCLAPFSSMYFDQFGNVLACCINTIQPLGSYPAQRLRDIWEGARAERLRSALADGDFSQGCHDCHRSIELGNVSGVHRGFDRFGPIADGAPEWPRMLEFALSTRCNLTCTMCNAQYSSAIRRAEGLPPLPEVYDPAFLDELRPFLLRAEVVKFYGGEPFLAPINNEILEVLAAENPSCEVSITTNGTIWNERIRSLIERLDVTVVVSIDGATEGTYEAIRRGADHAAVLANVEGFAAAARHPLTLAVCPMRQNWTEMPDLVDRADARGWQIGFNVVRYPQDHSLSSAPAAELEAVVAQWEAWFEQHPAEEATGHRASNRARFEEVLAEVRSWLAEALAPTEVDISSSSAASAGARRAAWLDLVAELVGAPPSDGAPESEAEFHEELDRLLDGLADRGSPEEVGAQIGALLGRLVEAPGPPDAEERFARLGQLIGSAPIRPRLHAMADLPPGLIAQGVAHEAPDVMAERFNAYFPPAPN